MLQLLRVLADTAVVLAIGSVEETGSAANPRYVVTSLSAEEVAPQRLYEEIYCARGNMENRIKECQLDLFADSSRRQVRKGAAFRPIAPKPLNGKDRKRTLQ
jgi:Transposase DDE domain group 1